MGLVSCLTVMPITDVQDLNISEPSLAVGQFTQALEFLLATTLLPKSATSLLMVLKNGGKGLG